MMIVMTYIIHGSYAAGIVFLTTPQSRNVSAGTMVEFTCAAPASELTSFGITTTPIVEGSVNGGSDLLNGDRKVTLNFIAPSDQISINIACVATTSTGFNQSFAVLMIQGTLSPVDNLTSTEVDNCTLHFTWTAPYTLQGVPINYYTINITRHSDGAVLRSDTTNTTEYLYSVRHLGETLEVVVAAVNGAGTGNTTSVMSQTSSSISKIKFISSIWEKETRKTIIIWEFTFVFEDYVVCGNAVSNIAVEACLNSSFCTNANETVDMLSNGERRVMTTFTDLMENRKYTATLNINYNGGVVQQSQPVEISTFDVRNATLDGPVKNGRVCLNVTYVEGHAEPASSYILFICSTTGINMYNGTIDQTENCMKVDPHPSYDILVTDADAAEQVINDAVAPVTITGVVVPNFTATASATQNTVSSSNIATTSLPSSDSGIIVIVSSTIGGLVVAAVIIIMILTFTILYCKKRHPANNKIKTEDRQLSEGRYYEHEQRKQVDKIIYTDVGSDSQGAPRPALPIYDVLYSDGQISIGQKQCLERLAEMKTSQLMSYSILFTLLQPLAMLWNEFREALYLAPYLDDIQTKHSSDEERLQAVLICWEKNLIRPYTWETLDEVLRSSKIGANYLADELKKKTSTASTKL